MSFAVRCVHTDYLLTFRFSLCRAGNLNHGLKLGATLSGTPAPYIAGLDVDMIVKPNWLRAMMPHLLADPKMAMTCPPQYFWNIPQNDHVRQDLDYFYAITGA